MSSNKADIIARLQREILPLQGFKALAGGRAIDLGLGELIEAFPNASFPTAAMHEFICKGGAAAAATAGFIGGLLGGLMRNDAVSVWISSSRTLFPPALKYFGIEPDKIIFVDLARENDVLWAMEEALKCEGLSTVVGEIKEIGFTASRRLQLAVEKSRVTGFIIRKNPKNINTIASIARWRITAMPSIIEKDLPGVGFPSWKVELLKIRNGKPGIWNLQWARGGFQIIPTESPVLFGEFTRKTG